MIIRHKEIQEIRRLKNSGILNRIRAYCGDITEDEIYTYLINSKRGPSSVGTGNAGKNVTLCTRK